MVRPENRFGEYFNTGLGTHSTLCVNESSNLDLITFGSRGHRLKLSLHQKKYKLSAGQGVILHVNQNGVVFRLTDSMNTVIGRVLVMTT